MRLELYQQETERLARDLQSMLDEVRQRLLQQQTLSALENAGVLHALQVLTENAIGKAKLSIKARGLAVPVSGYDAFAQLHRDRLINEQTMREWTAAIGLRNRIVHDYLNVDMAVIETLTKSKSTCCKCNFCLARLQVWIPDRVRNDKKNKCHAGTLFNCHPRA